MLDVLVVAGDHIASSTYRRLVDQTPGFRSLQTARDHRGALESAERRRVDIVLVDLTREPAHGLALCRDLAALEAPPDVIVLTPPADLPTLRTAVRLGVLHVLLLPLESTTLRDRLRGYARYRAATATARKISTQGEVDSALSHLRVHPRPAQPKGLSAETLVAVRETLRSSDDGLTAVQVADLTGLARVTARRYLEHLVTAEGCLREPVRGRRGRPELLYSCRPDLRKHQDR